MTAAQRILRLIEKERVEGRTEEKRASVVKMFNKNIILNDISDITGLSKKEVERILEN